jgi:hypothetical protein
MDGGGRERDNGRQPSARIGAGPCLLSSSRHSSPRGRLSHSHRICRSQATRACRRSRSMVGCLPEWPPVQSGLHKRPASRKVAWSDVYFDFKTLQASRQIVCSLSNQAAAGRSRLRRSTRAASRMRTALGTGPHAVQCRTLVITALGGRVAMRPSLRVDFRGATALAPG